ncbi:MAG: hypothetical protein PHQ40_02795 [Anaerolineaceae bacterium]|nr:hypothetical protein [Anaerolineaceae bacterium]
MSASNSPFFDANFDYSEIAQILEKIDNNIRFREELFKPDENEAFTDELPPPSPVSIPDVGNRVSENKNYHAPYFISNTRSLSSLVKLLLNLPIKLFGRKQHYFNREVLDMLASLNVAVHDLSRLAEYDTKLYSHVIRQSGNLEELTEKVKTLTSQVAQNNEQIERLTKSYEVHHEWLQKQAEDLNDKGKWLEQLGENIRSNNSWLQQMDAEQKGLNQGVEQLGENIRSNNSWLQQMDAEQKGLSKWVDLVDRKQKMLALDLRESVTLNRPSESMYPEPRFIHPDTYPEKIRNMGNHLMVNLGCGEKPLPGYINVDYREVPDVDIIADIHRLPFEPGTLSEIASAHLVEHFREHHFKKVILPYWKQLLSAGGCLRIICPNWAAMLDRLNTGEMSLEEFKLLTFGSQDYQGDDHFAMYTPDSLKNALIENGLEQVEFITEVRMNSICPEMEVVAMR